MNLDSPVETKLFDSFFNEANSIVIRINNDLADLRKGMTQIDDQESPSAPTNTMAVKGTGEPSVKEKLMSLIGSLKDIENVASGLNSRMCKIV